MVFSLPNYCLYPLAGLIFLASCNAPDDQDSLFKKLSSKATGITFENNLTYNKELNPYTYRNFYNGGGVGIADFNNDGLQDIFFTGNQVPNKLYLNEGGFRFSDISRQAGIESSGVWSTGVSVVDINGDGRLDIYVCKSGSPGGAERHNQLFINNGDSTFTDRAKDYGLDVAQLSVDAAFFDYDRDGDLDMYLLNNSFEPVTKIFQKAGLRTIPGEKGGNKLFRNETINPDGSSPDSVVFREVTNEAGIYNSRIGFGLDVLTGDINGDNWPDIYVTNDFFERDYLYLNNADGTFSEMLPRMMESISLSSMGGDLGDINHDGMPEIFVADMLPEVLERAKSKTTFDSWNEYQKRVEENYHNQFSRNTLQLNNGPAAASAEDDRNTVTFSEIGRLAGVEATDWSWTALFADLNNDGFNDLFVSNGVYKDLTDQDFVNNNQTIRKVRSIVEDDMPVDILFDNLSSVPIANYAFAGTDSLSFTNKAKEWGLGTPGFSNGAAYGDLDNDGDLDLVINNVNSNAILYENRAEQVVPMHNSLTVKLRGTPPNSLGVGAKVTVWDAGKPYYREQMPNRGFQSSVDPRIHFGLGSEARIDSLTVRWPDSSKALLKEVGTDQMLTIDQTEANKRNITARNNEPVPRKQNSHQLLQDVTNSIKIDYKHNESAYSDFNRNPLLYEMHSREGPASCVADINDDGLDDMYLGGAKGQAGTAFVQQKNKTFSKIETEIFELSKESEDTDCIWFDADGDEDLDLYVTGGSSEFPSSSSALADRLYLNNDLRFSLVKDALPQSQFEAASVVKAADFDSDGDTDLFVGSRMEPFAYGVPVSGYLLENNGKGRFTDITEKHAPDLVQAGMITDADWVDFDSDGDHDLIVAGEWMPIKIYENRAGEEGSPRFKEVTEELQLNTSAGLWKSIAIADLDGDGYKDILAGNLGLNSLFRASLDDPLQLWVNDFDQNGSIESIITKPDEDGAVPVALKQDLVGQMPRLDNHIKDYKSYATMRMSDLFTKEEVEQAQMYTVNELRNSIFWNEGGEYFTKKVLPQKAQLAPVFDAAPVKQGISDSIVTIVAGGNLSAVKPQFGPYLAGKGIIFSINKQRKISMMDDTRSGFYVEGEIRGIRPVQMADSVSLMIVRNDQRPVWFK